MVTPVVMLQPGNATGAWTEVSGVLEQFPVPADGLASAGQTS